MNNEFEGQKSEFKRVRPTDSAALSEALIARSHLRIGDQGIESKEKLRHDYQAMDTGLTLKWYALRYTDKTDRTKCLDTIFQQFKTAKTDATIKAQLIENIQTINLQIDPTLLNDIITGKQKEWLALAEGIAREGLEDLQAKSELIKVSYSKEERKKKAIEMGTQERKTFNDNYRTYLAEIMPVKQLTKKPPRELRRAG